MKKNIWKRLLSLALALVLVVGMMPHMATEAHAAEPITLEDNTFTTSPGEGFAFRAYFYCDQCKKEVYIDSNIENHNFEIISFTYKIANGTAQWDLTANYQGCRGSGTGTNTYSCSYNCTEKLSRFLLASCGWNQTTKKYHGAIDVYLTRAKTTHQGDATCKTAANCTLCGTSYTNANNHEKRNEFTYSVNTSDSTKHDVKYACCGATKETVAHTVEPTYTVNATDHTKHDKTYSCCEGIAETAVHSTTYSATSENVVTETCSDGCGHSATATITAEDATYTGSAITDAVTVEYSNNWAGSKAADISYTPKDGSILTDGKAVNVGSYTASVNVGTATICTEFEITPKSISGAGITFTPESVTYPDSTEAPNVTVKDGEKVLTLGTDYTLAWKDGTQWEKPAVNTLTITGKGNYDDHATAKYTISRGTMTGIEATGYEGTYDGEGHSITVTGIPEGATVTYSTNGTQYSEVNPAIANVEDSGKVYYKVSKEHYKDFVGSAIVTIKPKTVTVSGITAEDKEYDGSAEAALNYDGVAFAGKLDGDTLSVTATGTFDSKDAGENKSVSISGLTLGVTGAGNYTLAAAGQQTTATAAISPKKVTAVVAAENKVYDGDVTAAVSATVDTGISGESITVTGLTGSFDTADVGENKTVTVDSTNKLVTYSDNTQAGNYALTIPATTTANITGAPMTVTAAPYTGTYDGAAHGITVNAPDGATVKYGTSASSCTQDSLTYKNAGEYTVYYEVTKPNYTTVTGSAVVKITPVAITVTVDAIADQPYTGESIAPAVTVTPEENKLVGEDTLAKDRDYTVSYSANTNVGTATVTISDVEGGNYTVSGSGTFKIVKAVNSWTTQPAIEGWTYSETAKAPSGEAKFGDVTVTYAEKGKETFTSEVPTQAGDYTAKFAVADTTNYSALTATVDFTIAKKALTVTEAVATGREYDGTKTVAITAVTLDGIVTGDTAAVDLTDLTGTLESADKGTYTSVTLPALTLSAGSDNYALTQPTAAVKTDVEITAKPITVTVADIADQTWTGSALTPATVVPTGLVKEADEYCTVTYTGNTNVGLATVKVEAKGNYSFDTIEKTFLIVPNESLISGLTTDNVTSASKANVDKAVQMMNNADMNDAPAEDKADWEALKSKANALQDQLEAADAADQTQNIQDAEDINAGNVKPDQKQDLEDALKDLEDAKQTYSDNYTAEEKAALEADIKRIEDALAAIERVEDFNTAIDNSLLTSNVKTDMDAATEQAIKNAQAAYGKLTDHEKTLIDSADKAKLDALVTTMTAYKITKGGGARYAMGSGKTLSFTANGPVRKFDYIQVNGKTVASSNYTVTEGSTIITLKSSYLDKLGRGNHKIQVFYTDSSTDVANFRIYANGGNPFTGDNSHIMMFTGIMLTSLLCMVMVVMFVPWKKGKYQK